MNILLYAINNGRYSWKICGDLKVIGVLMKMQSSFAKHCSFVFLWDIRATDQRYVESNWPLRTSHPVRTLQC